MKSTPRRSGSRRVSIKEAMTPNILDCHRDHDENSGPDDFTVEFPDGLHLTTAGLLGCGGFGKVYIAKTPSGESFALKVSSKELSGQDFRRLREEIAIMNMLKGHPNVVRLETVGMENNRAYVVMEQCVTRSLSDLVSSRPLHFAEMLWIGYDLIRTIGNMHERGCIHRDIKPQNLLFDFHGALKVTDFGLSTRISENTPRKTVAGTAVYMAPEMAENYIMATSDNKQKSTQLHYGREIDVWSIGVVLYVLATRMTPYHRVLVGCADKAARQKRTFEAIREYSWSWPDNFKGDAEYVDLVESILRTNRENRPSLETLLQHPVWQRRPLSAPLSLLQTLKLVENPEGTPRKSLSARNAPSMNRGHSKRTAAEVIADGVNNIVKAEDDARCEIGIEYNEFIHFFAATETIFRNEIRSRAAVHIEAMAGIEKIRNQRRTTAPRSSGRREESVQLATGGEGPMRPSTGSVRSIRRSVSMVGGTVRIVTSENIVRASPDRLAVHIPGRESSHPRHTLRSTISLPPDAMATEAEYFCMNNHLMTKMTSIPSGYDGYDCNVCDAQINKLSRKVFMYRCHKCDLDICKACTDEGEHLKENELHSVCSLCGKRFPNVQKMHKHSLNCRGPSMSPHQESKRLTMEWGDDGGLGDQLKELQSPRGTVQSPRGSVPSRASTRQSTRLSVGPNKSVVGEPKHWSPDVVLGRPKFSENSPVEILPRQAQKESVATKETSTSRPVPSIRMSVELPPERQIGKRTRTYGQRLVEDDPEAEEENEEPPRGKQRRESADGGGSDDGVSKSRPNFSAPKKDASPVQRNSGGASRSRSQATALTGNQTIDLRAENAAKLPDVPKASPLQPKSPSRTKGQSKSVSRSAAPVGEMPQAAVVVPANQFPHPAPLHTAPNTVAVTSAPAQPLADPRAGNARRGTGGAYLALPQEPQTRQAFLEDFLSGPWIRSYAFANTESSFLYYSLQPGRYGAMFSTAAGLGTVVVDINAQTVLHVPYIKADTSIRREAHPHVSTMYDDDVQVLRMQEAQRRFGAVLHGILEFVNEIARLRSEGLPPVAVPASYIHNASQVAVPKDTKFAYLRRLFPDPDGMFVMFRLSNMRTQLVCNSAQLDVRWQSDRRNNITLKYYVHSDGSAIPFVNDSTGIMQRLETVLSTTFRV